MRAILISLLMLPLIATAEQCVPYARYRSGIEISGNAYEWWGKAVSKGAKPYEGAVLSLPQQGAYPLSAFGHVAFVSKVINGQEILIDHANWDGKETRMLGAKVKDVSGNWKRVLIEIYPGSGYGTTEYVVNGFIYPLGMTESNPMCNMSSWKCSTRINGSIAWFPPVDDCQNAKQWYRLTTDTSGDVVKVETVGKSECPLACYPTTVQ